MTPTVRRLGPEVGVLCASAIAAAAIGQLFQGGLGGPALTALVLTAAVGSTVPTLLALKRVSLPVRAVTGTLAVILTSLWTALGDATTYGVPTPHTWHVVQTQLRAAQPLLSQFAVPIRPAPGLVFLAAMTCGVVAMLAAVLLHASDTDSRLYPGLALLSPLGLLAFACSQSTPRSMVAFVIVFVGAGALTMTTARPARPARTERPGPTQAAQTPRATRPRRWVTPSILTACTMAAVGLVAALADTGAAGAGSSGAGVAPAVPLTAESLTSKLVSVEVHDASGVLFRATSHVRTYWQVAVLDVLRNGVWVPGPATRQAARHSLQGAVPQPGTNVTPARGHAVTSHVEIDDLSSRILPVPPGTVSVSGTAATLTDVGAVSSSPSTPGQQYRTLSAPPVTEPGTLGGNDPVSIDPPALLHANTALPPLPSTVQTLARSIASGAPGPLTEAEDLVDWFRSGLFHYTLTPPATPVGADPLVSFLTRTRSGTCEQFAGAYVILARSLGLPSRVVVGFTAGRSSGPDTVTVTGADAHAWPQVYLGPRAGWVSFEPTPQQPRGEVAPEGVIGPSGVTVPTAPVSPHTTAPSPTAPPTTPPTVITTTPNQPGASPATAPTSGSGSSLGTLGWILLGLAVVLVSVFAALVVRRRRRWSPVDRTPEQLAVLARDEVTRALRRTHANRPPWQPLDLFFEDMGAGPPEDRRRPAAAALRSQGSDRTSALAGDGLTVARVADAALFDPLPMSSERSRAAYEAALRVRHRLKEAEAASTSPPHQLH